MEVFTTYLILEEESRNIPLLEETTIGRGLLQGEPQPGRIFFPEAEVSRVHAVIRRIGAYWCLLNRSKNGTKVNFGIVHEEERLRHGDKIRVGPHTLIFCDSREETMEIVSDEAGEKCDKMGAFLFLAFWALAISFAFFFVRLLIAHFSLDS